MRNTYQQIITYRFKNPKKECLTSLRNLAFQLFTGLSTMLAQIDQSQAPIQPTSNTESSSASPKPSQTQPNDQDEIQIAEISIDNTSKDEAQITVSWYNMTLNDPIRPHMTSKDEQSPILTANDPLISGRDRETERIWKFKSVWTWWRIKTTTNLQPCTNSMFSRDLFYRNFLGVNEVDLKWPWATLTYGH